VEAKWLAVTAIAPVAWGSNYYVTREFLPAGHPLYGALFRALPAGLLLLAIRPRRPARMWRLLVLGTLNVGAFFVLIYVAAQQLPTSLASTVMATSPVVMMLFAWLVLADPPRARHLTGAALGIAGVALLLLTGVTGVSPAGVLASVAAMTMSSFGYVLAKKWGSELDVLSLTAWQLIAGALVLLPVAAVVETPPHLDGRALLGFGYVTVVATAVAFAAWFAGLRHLDAGTVGLVGLLNPVTGVLLGTVIAVEALSTRQVAGLALVLAGIVVPHVGRRRSRSYASRCGESIAEAGFSDDRALRRG